MFIRKKDFEAYKTEKYKEFQRVEGRINTQRDNFNDDLADLRDDVEKHATKIASNNKFIRSISSKLSAVKQKHGL